jgi:hypothetical protein
VPDPPLLLQAVPRSSKGTMSARVRSFIRDFSSFFRAGVARPFDSKESTAHAPHRGWIVSAG